MEPVTTTPQPEDEFYVGYLPQPPTRYARFSKRVAWLLLLGVILIPLVLVLHQKPFSTSSFEYGTLTEVEGVLYKSPIPMMKMVAGTDAFGKPVYQTALLINLGKFGADPLLKQFEEKLGQPLEQTFVKVRGTLLYYDGVTLLELTEQENALVGAFANRAKTETASLLPHSDELGEVTLQGEIIDPKCYFGAMKPGRSKPHRSCAIRCISGGIPPVFVVSNGAGDTNYYLLTDENGQAIHQEILDHVAEPIQLKGRLSQRDDWYVLRIHPGSSISRLNASELSVR
jgi:hypothetical protein